MAKHVIFLVHGMGEFSTGWSDDTKKQIKSLYSAYQIAKEFPFDVFFRFEEITYGKRFDSLRKQWGTNSKAVLATLQANGLQKGAANELAKYGSLPAADNFLATHLLDVFLYRFIPQVAEEVRTGVASTILKSLLDGPSDDIPTWSLVAHSLGTSVAHDTLHALYTEEIDGRTLAGITKARVVAMVSNVSRLLEEKSVDVYRSVVHPGAQPDDGVCRYFLNIKHEWDPFPRPQEFRPLDDWPDVLTRQQGRYVPITINAFQSKDIHSLPHYLANPSVHVPLFNRMFPMGGAISDAEFGKARSLYEATTPFGKFEKLQQQMKEFQIAELASWQQVIRAFSGFLDAVRDF